VKSRAAVVLSAVLLAAFAGCSKQSTGGASAPGEAASKPSPSASARRFPFRGVVRAVDPGKREVTVEHEAIPDYMDAMTMSFPVKDDPQVFEILHPGDRLEAKLVVDRGSYWLEQILTKGFVGTPAAGAAAAVVTPQPNRGVAVGDPIPDFALTDQTGHTVRLSQLRGDPIAVTFLYTRCPIATACPLTATKFAKLDSLMKAKGFGKMLTITVDPEHDTPKVLAEYASHLGADPARWKFLTGDPKAVADVATSFGVLYYPEHGQVVHAQAAAVIDPSGRLAAIYYGQTWEAEHLLRDLEKARKG
jgi:protein SCO1/2